MEDLVRLASAKLGVGEDTVRSALGVILNLIKQHAEGSDAEALLAKLPGAEALLGSGGGGGGLLGGLGAAIGGGLGDALGAAGALNESGLESGQMGDLVGLFSDYAKEQAGDDLAQRVMGSLPGLDGLMG